MKEYNYEDILLYNVRNGEIVVIFNDQEQLNKFRYTGLKKDAPVREIPYSVEEEDKIVDKMKKIAVVREIAADQLEVVYIDGTSIIFDNSSKDAIEMNLKKQRELSKKKEEARVSSMPVEEKENKKKEANKNSRRYLAGVLAALVIAGGAAGAYFAGKHTKPIDRKSNDEDPTKQDLRRNEQIEQTVTTTSQYTNEGKRLHEETLAKDSFILRYQQLAGVRWNEELATEIVEFLNDVYPTSMTYMSSENANAETTEALEALELLVAGNLNSETNVNNMIDLGQYINNEGSRILLNNALVIARGAVNESIGEPVNGAIIDEGDYASINKFSREYLNAVDQLLNYEYDTITDPLFLQLPSGVRYLITSIFQQANAAVVPTFSTIKRGNNVIYYRYFNDIATGVNYTPRATSNGQIEYVGTNGEVYSENQIFAMAGTPLVLDDRNYTENVNPNLQQLGIQPELDRVYEAAREEIFGMKNTYTVRK